MSPEGPRGRSTMTTFILLHGSGDGGWAWHLVQRALRGRGHEAIAPDLPTDREGVTYEDCVDLVAGAVSARGEEVVVVGQSSGGFHVPLVAQRLGARLQVYVAGMVPRPGERPAEWFDDVGWAEAVAEVGGLPGDPLTAFFHDVPPDLAAEAMARERPVSERLGAAPWPMASLPTIPAAYVVTTQDRFIPPVVQWRVAADRLGVTVPAQVDAGHCAHLSRPAELAAVLLDCEATTPSRTPPGR